MIIWKFENMEIWKLAALPVEWHKERKDETGARRRGKYELEKCENEL